ncbi:MAG: hypothetical protein KF830_06395 [Planctomycetes bacterium]|nr:hypothetical protein [Planctomycetota bacterium]
MSPLLAFVRLLPAFATGLGLAAQVVTVGGAGADYPDLVQAVAAVAPDTVLSVRPGKYRGFTTSKPLRIHLDFDATTGRIEPAPGAAYAIVLNGMPAGGTFVLAGAGAPIVGGTLGGIRIANTGGRVFVEGLVVDGGGGAAIDVQNTGPVLLHDCDLAGTPGLAVQTATLVANAVRVTGAAGHGVAASGAALDFAGGSYAGSGLPALRLVNSSLRLAGDGTTVVKVGGTGLLPVPAIDAQNAVVAWDPQRFLVVPANGAAPLVAAGGSVHIEDPPLVRARGGAPGALGSIRCTGNVPAPGLVVVAPFAPPLFLDLAGLYVDLAQPYAVALVGIVDAAGLAGSFTMPTAPALLGSVSCVQAATLPPSGLSLSAPAPWITF